MSLESCLRASLGIFPSPNASLEAIYSGGKAYIGGELGIFRSPTAHILVIASIFSNAHDPYVGESLEFY